MNGIIYNRILIENTDYNRTVMSIRNIAIIRKETHSVKYATCNMATERPAKHIKAVANNNNSLILLLRYR